MPIALKITKFDIHRLVVDIKKDIGPSHRQDYALFVRFDSVGSKDGFLRDDNSNTMKSKYEMNRSLNVYQFKFYKRNFYKRKKVASTCEGLRRNWRGVNES